MTDIELLIDIIRFKVTTRHYIHMCVYTYIIICMRTTVVVKMISLGNQEEDLKTGAWRQ